MDVRKEWWTELIEEVERLYDVDRRIVVPWRDKQPKLGLFNALIQELQLKVGANLPAVDIEPFEAVIQLSVRGFVKPGKRRLEALSRVLAALETLPPGTGGSLSLDFLSAANQGDRRRSAELRASRAGGVWQADYSAEREDQPRAACEQVIEAFVLPYRYEPADAFQEYALVNTLTGERRADHRWGLRLPAAGTTATEVAGAVETLLGLFDPVSYLSTSWSAQTPHQRGDEPNTAATVAAYERLRQACVPAQRHVVGVHLRCHTLEYLPLLRQLVAPGQSATADYLTLTVAQHRYVTVSPVVTTDGYRFHCKSKQGCTAEELSRLLLGLPIES